MKHIKIFISTLLMLFFVTYNSVAAFEANCEDDINKNLNLIVTINGQVYSLPAKQVIAICVENEMGSTFPTEALKAQAIATHTYLLRCNKKNTYPLVTYKQPSKKVITAVTDVVDLVLCYGDKNKTIAFTPYCSSVADKTNNARDIWGNEDTISVESKYDYEAPTYKTQCKYSLNEVRTLFKEKWGLNLDDVEPQNIFKVLTKTSGGYNNRMSVGSYNTYYRKLLNRDVDITARLIREEVLTKLGSPKFEIEYNCKTEEFLFTSYGLGHGVGMSQYGAKLYNEKENWSYEKILRHYYPYGYIKHVYEL